MEQRQLEVQQVFEGLWTFIKKQFKHADTWAMISGLSFFGVVGCLLLISFLIGLNVLYFVFNALAIFDFQQNPLIFIGLIVLTLSVMYLVYKLCQKTIGLGNVPMLNTLAAVEDKTLPK